MEDPLSALQKSHLQHAGNCANLLNQFCTQLDHLLSREGITLAIPIEKRVKSWDSISGKIDRKNISISCVTKVDDLIGVRLITLFRRDAEKVHKILETHIDILTTEDTSERLADTQFGYHSIHYLVKPPENWQTLPTMHGLGDYKIEIQVRTMAQHIWAVVSHKLQYKNEESVPPDVRRSINRASALLETVDLEFERVLQERETYVAQTSDIEANNDDQLNVDSLERVLDMMLPIENKATSEAYSELLTELSKIGITTIGRLAELIGEHYDHILSEENSSLSRLSEGEAIFLDNQERDFRRPEDSYRARYYRGVYFTHAGMLRHAIAKVKAAKENYPE